MTDVDFLFDITCPFAYLASTQLEAVAQRCDARFRWRPVLLGGLFQSAGTPQNLPGTLSPAKARHTALDALRYAELYDVPLVWHPRHPVRSLLVMRVLTALAPEGTLDVRGVALAQALYEAHWVRSEATDDSVVLRRVLDERGYDGAAVLAQAGSDVVKAALRANTEVAAQAGAFGVPTFLIHRPEGVTRLYGQDRLERLVTLLGGEPRAVPSAAASAASIAGGRLADFYFDFSSPFAYVGAAGIEAAVAAGGGTLQWQPMLLGGLFRAIGQVDVPLVTFSPAKQRWMFEDLQAAAAELGVPFRWPSRFPMRTLLPLRLVLAVPEAQRAPVIHRIFTAYWGEDRDIASEVVLRELLAEAGFAGETDAWLAGASDPAVKAQLQNNTELAAELGVFGAPSAVVDGQVFWGQDRLHLVTRALAADV